MIARLMSVLLAFALCAVIWAEQPGLAAGKALA